MEKLNFPVYNFRFKNSENKTYIFDIIRKKFLLLTPEEWVRQHTLFFLINELNYPISLINVEKLVNVNGIKKRYDIVVFNSNGSISVLVECKAPEVTINQKTFDQIAQYNLILKAKNLMVTNGLNHYFCQMDFENEKYVFLKNLPEFKTGN
ncbi:type I restriction enzyme HsdR N-terminal domain-containing protein [Flavobacterium sp.]|uniref:type I restriction enzyme HsdR N-terminal domain-containing protein n=1 Tax=Flavobacterium sp. TaxID=239 RepID=UPI003527EB14